MGLDRNGFSCRERWITYLKHKLTSPPRPRPRPRHDVKGTENKEVKSHNLHSLLHSTATPTTSQNVGVFPMHNILTGIANKKRMINIITGMANDKSMFSSGVPIHANKEVKSQNLHSVLHSTPTPTPTPIPAPPQNIGVLPMHNILTGIENKRRMHNILTGITDKRSMFSSGVPIEQNKRFKAAEATTYNPPKMFLKPGTELTLNSFSAAIATQQSTAVLRASVQSNATLPESINIPTAIGAQLSASVQSGNILKSHSKELPSKATIPRRIRSQILHYATDIELIPTSSPATSNANQITLCKEHEGYIIAQAPSDAEHATLDGGTMESDCLIISQGTNYPMEELFGHIEKRVMSDSMDELLGKSAKKDTSENQLAPSSLVKEQVEKSRFDHLFHEFEMLVQNSDAKHATSDEGMTEGSGSITPQGTDHLMVEQLVQSEKQERSKNLGGECGTMMQYSGADEIYDESRYFSNEEDAEIFCLLKGFVQSDPSPYLYSPISMMKVCTGDEADEIVDAGNESDGS